MGKQTGSGLVGVCARVRELCTAAAFLSFVLSVSWAAPPRAARTENPRTPDRWAEVQELLRQQEQRSGELAATAARLDEEIGQMQKRLHELVVEVRPQREQVHALQETLRDMREEVRGLYVESSGLKGDIAQVADKLDGLAEDLTSFRLSAGIIAALIVLLQIIGIGLAVRMRS